MSELRIERVKPITVNEMEFYVSTDGTRAGMSMNSLSKFLGVHLQTLSRLLTNVQNGGVKGLEGLQGKVFQIHITSAGGGKPAKIIDSAALFDVAIHYGKEGNVQALQAATQFGRAGGHAFVLTMTKYQPAAKPTATDARKELLVLARKLIDFELGTTEAPGARNLVEGFSNYQQVLPMTPLTLPEYLEFQDVTVDPTTLQRLRLAVAESFKNLYHKAPVQRMVPVKGSKKLYPVGPYEYPCEAFHLIDNVLSSMGLM